MTLPEMASEIERLRPGTLRDIIDPETGCLWMTTASDDRFRIPLPDAALAAILRDAMVMATNARRGHGGWEVVALCTNDLGGTAYRTCFFPDRDHANDHTASLFAAFRAACGEAKP